MGVVGPAELVLDEDPMVIKCILAEDVRFERPDVLLGGLKLQLVDAQALSQLRKVRLLCQPRRESSGSDGQTGLSSAIFSSFPSGGVGMVPSRASDGEFTEYSRPRVARWT
jgi:hypothetical protein